MHPKLFLLLMFTILNYRCHFHAFDCRVVRVACFWDFSQRNFANDHELLNYEILEAHSVRAFDGHPFICEIPH